MIRETSIPKYFLANAINTTCYVLNKFIIRSILEKTRYELTKGRKPNIFYFRLFGYKCFILNNKKGNLGKFNVKSDEGIFLGYSSRTTLVEESIHVAFDESSPQKRGKIFILMFQV